MRRVLITRAYVEKFGPTPDCSKCRAIQTGDNANPTLAHSRDCRARMEGLLALDPALSQRLDRAQSRQDDYLARRVEAGDASAQATKRFRGEPAEVLLPGPGGASEIREAEPEPNVDMDGEPLHSRAASTVTCKTDIGDAADVDISGGDDVEIPIPMAETSAAAASSSAKRPHEGPEGDEDRGDEQAQDPADPEDMADVSLIEAPRVLMLGEKRRMPGKIGEGVHDGQYEVCELFSPSRVAGAASAKGLRGGWSLDLNHPDPITGAEWDLSEVRAQQQVWKLIRRDKPLCIGLSPECTLFSALQNLRKTEIPPEELKKAINCVSFCRGGGLPTGQCAVLLL